mgnify:CR=1 FL=1
MEAMGTNNVRVIVVYTLREEDGFVVWYLQNIYLFI